MFASGTALPLLSNLNCAPGQNVATVVVVPVSGNGAVQLHVSGPVDGTVQLVADTVGHYRS